MMKTAFLIIFYSIGLIVLYQSYASDNNDKISVLNNDDTTMSTVQNANENTSKKTINFFYNMYYSMDEEAYNDSLRTIPIFRDEALIIEDKRYPLELVVEPIFFSNHLAQINLHLKPEFQGYGIDYKSTNLFDLMRWPPEFSLQYCEDTALLNLLNIYNGNYGEPIKKSYGTSSGKAQLDYTDFINIGLHFIDEGYTKEEYARKLEFQQEEKYKDITESWETIEYTYKGSNGNIIKVLVEKRIHVDKLKSPISRVAYKAVDIQYIPIETIRMNDKIKMNDSMHLKSIQEEKENQIKKSLEEAKKVL